MEIGSRHNKNLKQSHPKRLKRGNNVLKRCDEKEAVMLKVTSVSNRYLNNMIYNKQTNKQTNDHTQNLQDTRVLTLKSQLNVIRLPTDMSVISSDGI